MNTIDKFNSHVMQSYGRYPLVMEQGSGRRCKDENGTEYPFGPFLSLGAFIALLFGANIITWYISLLTF